MKTILITEFTANPAGTPREEPSYTLNLTRTEPRQCCGCWSCWWRTPGRCVYRELDDFYHEYVTADRAVFFAKNARGFVTGNMKSLFDRMIPLFLPYTTYRTGESMHVKRYEKYPDIEFYYDDANMTADDREIYEEYIGRVFYQFYSNKIFVRPIEDREKEVAYVCAAD